MRSLIVMIAFMANAIVTNGFQTARPTSFVRQSTILRETPQGMAETESFLAQNYPGFFSLVSRNEGAWKEVKKSGLGYTIFAANSKVFEDLGEKKCNQLLDDRNGETTQKIGACHFINEAVSPEQLFASGGIITLGGEIPVGRSKKGGFFGFGGEEDGGVTVNGANVVESFEIAGNIIHEVDALISPEILWRYIDQLRIPGSS